MKRAKFVAPLVATLLVLAALPLIGIHVGPELDDARCPRASPSVRGLLALQAAGSRYSADPTTIIVSSRPSSPARTTTTAIARLDRLLRADPQVTSVSPARLDQSGRYLRIEVVEPGRPVQPAGAAVRRATSATSSSPRLVSPPRVVVLAGGGAAYAADFVSRTLGSFPWLILGVLGLTYLLLVRAFRSLLLPLKAIALNLLTVSAASGLMIAIFQWGWGSWAGLLQVNVRSRAGSPSSCSRCSSGSRWTTRSSSSPACARPGTRRGRISGAVSPRPREHRP